MFSSILPKSLQFLNSRLGFIEGTLKSWKREFSSWDLRVFGIIRNAHVDIFFMVIFCQLVSLCCRVFFAFSFISVVGVLLFLHIINLSFLWTLLNIPNSRTTLTWWRSRPQRPGLCTFSLDDWCVWENIQDGGWGGDSRECWRLMIFHLDEAQINSLTLASTPVTAEHQSIFVHRPWKGKTQLKCPLSRTS